MRATQRLGTTLLLALLLISSPVTLKSADLDRDGIDDDLEETLARSFLPWIWYWSHESCQEPGVILYHVRPFTPGGSTDTLAVTYMTAYYNDCGFSGHDFDLETFAVTLYPAAGSPSGYGAHSLTTFAHRGSVCEHSDTRYYSPPTHDFGAPGDTVYSSWEEIWVSDDKHGFFLTDGDCDPGCLFTDECGSELVINDGGLVPPEDGQFYQMFNIGEINDHLIENYTELNSMGGFSFDPRSVWGVWWTDEDYYLVSPGPALPVHFEFASFPYPNPIRRCQEDNIGLDLPYRSLIRAQIFSGITGELMSDDYLGEFCPEDGGTYLLLWDGRDGGGNCLSNGPKIARLTAYRGGNSYDSNIELNVGGDSVQKPSSPSNLSLSLVDNYVLLSWDDNATDEIGFTVERRAGSCAFTQPAELDSHPGTGSVEYQDHEVETGETYVYRVLARGDGGRSGPSNRETVAIPACADNPYMIISGPTILADTIFSSESYQVEVETNDSDCPFVQYEWSVHGNQYCGPGTIVGSGSRVTYIAPTFDCDQLNYPAFRNTIDVTTRYCGLADSSSTDWFIIRCPRPDTTGCPFLYVWDGEGYAFENNLLPSAALTTSAVVDYYALRGRAEPVGGEYLLEIREDEREHSVLDKIELFLVDHPAHEKVGVTQEGRIISYTDLIPPAAATDAAGEDILQRLLEIDGKVYAGDRGTEAGIGFDQSGPGVLVLLAIPGEKKKSLGPLIISGGRGTDDGNKGGICLPRLIGGYQFLDVPPEGDKEGGLEISLFWPEAVSVDYIGMIGTENRTVAGRSLRLNRALHSDKGEVAERLDKVDDQAVTLDPGEKVDLFFEAPPLAGGLKRDLIVTVNGRYDR